MSMSNGALVSLWSNKIKQQFSALKLLYVGGGYHSSLCV